MRSSSPLISLVLLLIFAVAEQAYAQEINSGAMVADSTVTEEYADSTVTDEYADSTISDEYADSVLTDENADSAIIEESADSFLSEDNADSALTKEYTVNLNVRGHEMSGISIFEFRTEKEVVGTLMSNFGAKIFDFVYDGRKTKILNVMKPINRWYIRKVLKKDFNFIITNLPAKRDKTEKQREMRVLPDGSISITNHKFKIKYLFSEISENETHQ